MAPLLHGFGFVTGAASGIGKATAVSLLKHGAKGVVIGDINTQAIKHTMSELKARFAEADILPVELDVTNEDTISKAVADAVKAFGRIDYAVNNAGVGGPRTLSDATVVQEWRKTFDINLHGVWMSSRAEIRQMLQQEPLEQKSSRHGRGVIVNVASIYGLIGTPVNVSAGAYAASKHAVLGVTKADAIAYASKGIRINAVCPGYVATPMLQSGPASEALQMEIQKTPLGRLSDAEEVADTIVFLSSPLSSYICGTALAVDGGYTSQ